MVREVAAGRGLLLLDLAPEARGRRGLFVDTVHMSGRGYALVAELMRDALRPTLEEWDSTQR